MGDFGQHTVEYAEVPSTNSETVVEDIECRPAGMEPVIEPDSTETTEASETSPQELVLVTPRENPPKTDPPNPAFLKPFESGWKRELVYRNPNGDNKRRVDVYYHTPSGKKLRSLKSIAEHLEGTELTLDNFTFIRASMGVDDSEKEIVRNAKRSFSDDSFGFTKKTKVNRKSCPDLSGTPRVVFKNGSHESDDGVAHGHEDLDDDTCSWLPPMWGKLLSILNRQY